jgi:hypothetical protein
VATEVRTLELREVEANRAIGPDPCERHVRWSIRAGVALPRHSFQVDVIGAEEVAFALPVQADVQLGGLALVLDHVTDLADDRGSAAVLIDDGVPTSGRRLAGR